jgi:hypothetical protein
MEEAVGDCTNIHLRYPSLVYGFYHVILANRTIQIGQHRLVRSTNDVSVADDDSVEPQVMRYLLAIEALSGRKNQWEEPSAYEAIAVRMIESDPATAGQDFEAVSPESPLHPRNFMEKLLRIYDIRYPYMAESVLAARRVEWSPRSPLFDVIQERTGQYLENTLGYLPRYS